MASGRSFELPGKIKKFLEKVSRPLDDEIKRKRNKEAIKNDFLLVSSRVDHILEKIYQVMNSQSKTDKDRETKFERLIDLLLILLSNIIFIFCITATGWSQTNKLSKQQDLKLGRMLRTLNTFAKKFIPRYKNK